MSLKKNPYYHIDEKPKVKKRRTRRFVALFFAIVLLGAGAYLFVLTLSPDLLPSKAEAASATEDSLVHNGENFVKVERLNLLVPFHTGEDAKTLESGAWWRYPERGNPEKGGNFILSAHRFRLGMTPNKTKERSPFYYVDKLRNDDIVDVFYNGKWYSYKVTEIKQVKPNDVAIEDPSDTAKLTMYTCSIKGSADGRVVVIAQPIVHESAGNSDSGSSSLL